MTRYLGLDFGDRTVGVAVSCPRGITATGVETLRRRDPAALKAVVARLRTLIDEYKITHIILGNPLHMDGNPSARSALTHAFAEKLRRNFKRLTVTLWDERLSTQAVRRVLRDASRVDEMAAVYILQSYLDATAHSAPTEMKGDNMNEQLNEQSNEQTNEQLNEQLIMTDEDGNEQPFDVLATKEYEGTVYMLAVDASIPEDEAAEVVHLKCIATEGEDMIFEFIDPEDEEFQRMAEIFEEEYNELEIEFDEERDFIIGIEKE